jgi:molecular chaperone HscB
VTDKFAILGVPRRYDLATEELEARFRELSRKVHPDRFARAAPAERLRALQAATALNDAYRALKTPVGRAEHLLELAGMKLAENDPVDQALLLEVLELREGLAEAQASGDEPRARGLTDEVAARRAASMRRVGELFAAGTDLGEVKRELIALRYFQRFLDEAAGEEAA